VATGPFQVLTADCKARNAPRFASPSPTKLTSRVGLSNRPFGPSLEAAGKLSPHRKTAHRASLGGLAPESAAPYNLGAQ